MPWSGSCGYRFTVESLLAYAPLEPGVFGLYNEGGVFIGKTLTLRQSLINCVTEKSGRWQDEEPTGYTFEICSEAECEELRDQLILEYVPYIPPILPEVPKDTINQPDKETIWHSPTAHHLIWTRPGSGTLTERRPLSIRRQKNVRSQPIVHA
jgi:hypothetical protein